MESLLVCTPHLFAFLCVFVCVFYGVIYESSGYATSNTNLYPVLLQNCVALCMLTLVYTFVCVYNTPNHDCASVLMHTFVSDTLSYYASMFICISTILTLACTRSYLVNQQINSFEYTIFILASASSMIVLTSANDFVSVYLAIELESLCFYVLTACKRQSEFATEAALKYFFLGAFSSGIFLFGCSIVYGCTGTTGLDNLSVLYSVANVELSTSIGMCFVCVGLFFKLSAAPFHIWTPDVYQGAPTSVTAYFSIVPKISMLIATYRILQTCEFTLCETLLGFVCACSLIVGSILAIQQRTLKRMFAYSSVGHVGYLLLALCTQTVYGLESAILYMIVYVLINVCVFTVMIAVSLSAQNVSVYDVRNLRTNHPPCAFAFTIALFALSGIPPLAGFFSKLCVFYSAVCMCMYTLLGIAVVCTSISLFYSLRLVNQLWFTPTCGTHTFGTPRVYTYYTVCVTYIQSYVLSTIVCFLVLFGLYPQPLYTLCTYIAYTI
jgi:NADH-quinone oxidoreductase subunit N